MNAFVNKNAICTSLTGNLDLLGEQGMKCT